MIMTAGCCDDEEHKSCTFTEEVSTDKGRQEVTCECANRTDYGDIFCSPKIWYCSRPLIDGEEASKHGDAHNKCISKGLRDPFPQGPGHQNASEHCLNNLD